MKIKSFDVANALMIIITSVTLSLGIFICIKAIVIKDVYLLVIGVAFASFGSGFSIGLGMMRHALLKYLEKQGVFKVEGKKGKETISFIPLKEDKDES